MDDDNGRDDGLPQPVRLALALAVICLAALGLLTLVDMQIKRAIVDKADEARRYFDEVMTSGRPQPQRAARPGPRPAVPDDVHYRPGGDAGSLDTGGQEDGGQAASFEVVRPGDESARPPRRGGVDGA